MAAQKLMEYLPQDLRPDYEPILFPDEDSYEWLIVKAADCISAYLKCADEGAADSGEFRKAQKNISISTSAIKMPGADEFMWKFAPGFGMPADALN